MPTLGTWRPPFTVRPRHGAAAWGRCSTTRFGLALLLQRFNLFPCGRLGGVGHILQCVQHEGAARRRQRQVFQFDLARRDGVDDKLYVDLVAACLEVSSPSFVVFADLFN